MSTILEIVSSHPKGASTYRIYEDIAATGFKNKPRVMASIKLLHKHHLLTDVKISEKKKNKQLTFPGRLIVDNKSSIDPFFKDLEAFSNSVIDKFSSDNDNVLQLRGWTREDLTLKAQYFLRMMTFVFEVGVYINHGLLSRFSIAVVLLGDNKLAQNIVVQMVIDGLRNYYEKRSLPSLGKIFPRESLKQMAAEKEGTWQGLFVPWSMTENVLSSIDNIKVENHCSAIREDMGKFITSLRSLVDFDASSTNLSYLGQLFNEEPAR